MNASTGRTDVTSKVFIVSPYKNENPVEFQKNVDYAKQILRDSLSRGEAPFLPHMLYTEKEFGRSWSINAGHTWLESADKFVIYSDRGISNGMKKGLSLAKQKNIPIEYRMLPNSNLDADACNAEQDP